MENELSIREKNSLKTFLIFAFLLLVLLFIGFSINSSYFKVKSIEIDKIEAIDIDEPSDFIIAETLHRLLR